MRGPQHEFCAKMKFPAQKNKNSSVNGTTSLAVIVGPKCLIAHLLAPHDRAFSLQDTCIEYFTSPNPMWGDVCVYCTVVAAGRGILFLVF